MVDKYQLSSNSRENDMPSIMNKFQMHPAVEFDLWFLNGPFLVGLSKDYPTDFIKNIVSCNAAAMFGLKSVDKVRDKYLQDTELDVEKKEQDLIVEQIKKNHSFIHDIIDQITYLKGKPIGRVLAEWCLLRMEFSTLQLITIAKRGALYEGMAIARTQLEQIAWVLKIYELKDAAQIKNIKAQSSISELNKIHPSAGRMYGDLSAHSHWNFDAHTKALVFEEDKMGVLFSSVGNVIELLSVATRILWLLAGTIQKLMNADLIKLPEEDLFGKLEEIKQDCDIKLLLLSKSLAEYSEFTKDTANG